MDTNHVKTVVKYYNNEESIDGGEKQRKYVINNVKIDIIGLLMQTEVYGVGMTTYGSTGNTMVDSSKTFDNDYIGRTLVIGSDTWSVVSTGDTSDTLIVNGTANVTSGSNYALMYSVNEEKQRLIDVLRIELDQFSRQSQLERKMAESEAHEKFLAVIPLFKFHYFKPSLN